MISSMIIPHKGSPDSCQLPARMRYRSARVIKTNCHRPDPSPRNSMQPAATHYTRVDSAHPCNIVDATGMPINIVVLVPIVHIRPTGGALFVEVIAESSVARVVVIAMVDPLASSALMVGKETKIINSPALQAWSRNHRLYGFSGTENKEFHFEPAFNNFIAQ